MCGIALILSEASVPVTLHGGGGFPASEAEEVHRTVLLADDLKVALVRRGPDGIGSKKVFLQLKWESGFEEEESSLSSEESSKCNVPSNGLLQSIWPCKIQHRSSVLKSAVTQIDATNETEKGECLFCGERERRYFSSITEVPYACRASDQGMRSIVELHFLGATLQLRGISPVGQPLVDDSGNILVYNGEIFGGIHVGKDKNDGETLLHALQRCAFCCSGYGNVCCVEGELHVPDILSSIKGPWALIYWQAKSRTIWFGRDAFGRRSLLVHWPTDSDPHFMLSSVSPPSSIREISAAASTNNGFKSDGEGVDMMGVSCHWDELACGIYSVCLEATKERPKGTLQSLISGVRKHEWTNPLLKELNKWDRRHVDPKHDKSCSHGPTIEKEDALHSHPEIAHFNSDEKDVLVINHIRLHTVTPNAGNIHPAHKVLMVLRESVMRRTTLNATSQIDLCQITKEKSVPVALLFSGGLDSMILAALLHECLNSKYSIDLLNVSFDGMLAPDRISARAGLKELQRVAPSRRWQLVEIDADLSNFASETKHVMSLINPAKTYMDLNIGIALWLAAGGEGFVDGEICYPLEDSHRYKYKSKARILLVGSGADEQCAGYGRHRTKYRLGGWASLQEEMRLDMQRIWIRNMGRDDRCISDHGKEARFPFLDEDVVKALLEIPLWEIAELNEPVGRGDKKVLREVARLLGLEEASVLPKRAIQFGSRIARESNKMHFGSNRAANQASAGMVMIDKSAH